ncbi:MAG: hypothetical protein II857_00180 [Selenomonadaceae bacterium]|nr:hypothetical protein [Selenomonadaceae bacterium]
MIRKFIAAFVIIFFAASTTAFAAAETKSGEVVHRVTGIGQAPTNWDQRDSFAKTFARQAARINALLNLVEAIDGIILETKTVGGIEIITTQIPQNSKAFKLLEKNARQVGDTKFYFYDDGSSSCEVTMEVAVPADWKK